MARQGDPLRFFIHSVANQKNEGGPLVKKMQKQKLKRGSFSLVRYCMVREKKPFWFDPLGKCFNLTPYTIFRRTSKNNFDQFVWIEKKVTKLVAFHFMKRRLKTLTKSHDYSRLFSRLKNAFRNLKILKRSSIDRSVLQTILWLPSSYFDFLYL